MALRWVESWDHLATADLSAKYDGIAGSPAISSTNRTGGQSLVCTDNNTAQILTKVFDAQSTWIVGFAFRLVISGGNKQILQFASGATVQCGLWYLTGSTAVLAFYRGDGTTQLGTSGANALSSNIWYYVEVKVTISTTVGTVDVKVDGASWISLTGQNTAAAGGTTADRVAFRAGGSSGTSTARFFDDTYVLDGTGSAPTNDFLGDCKVECIRPSGNGNSSQLVGSDGNSTDNYLLVDETTPNGDTDYVESSTVGNKDTYVFGDLATTTGTVYGVQVNPYARKTDAGSRSIVSVARLSGTEADGAAKTLSTSYLFLPDVRETKPGGGSWTITDINNAEFGVKVNA